MERCRSLEDTCGLCKKQIKKHVDSLRVNTNNNYTISHSSTTQKLYKTDYPRDQKDNAQIYKGNFDKKLLWSKQRDIEWKSPANGWTHGGALVRQTFSTACQFYIDTHDASGASINGQCVFLLTVSEQLVHVNPPSTSVIRQKTFSAALLVTPDGNISIL